MELIRAGYKRTEVGVIPMDWEVWELREIVNFKTGPFGSMLHKSDYVDDGVPVINPMQIIDGRIIPTKGMMISEDVAKRLKDFRVSSGQVIIGRRGELGRSAYITDEQEGWLCGTGSMVLSPKKPVSIEFVQRQIVSPKVIRALTSGSVGTTMQSLNQASLGAIQIPLPPTKAEQNAIATALGDADALIMGLETLIAKKRAVKEGTMQELLSGKRRLPGFKSEWKELNLSRIAPLQRGFDLPNTKVREGEYPVVYSNGIEKYHEHFLIAGPGVVTGRSGTIGKVHFLSESYWPHNTTLWVTNFFKNDPLYIYYLLIFVNLARFASGSGVPTLNRNDIHIVNVLLPAPNEQSAIANILSDMDAEIATLETKLQKARAIKAGMMAELLTGNIRLI